jgi:hypothetical protein
LYKSVSRIIPILQKLNKFFKWREKDFSKKEESIKNKKITGSGSVARCTALAS